MGSGSSGPENYRPYQVDRRTLLVGSLAAVVGLLTAACQSSRPTPEVTPDAPMGLRDPKSYGRALMIMSTFEYSQFALMYGGAHEVEDGRGVTAGIVGFCTGTGDANMVIKKYSESQPHNKLRAKYGERLDEIDQEFADTDWSDPIGSLKGLQDKEKGLDFMKDWDSLAYDLEFQKAQLAVYEQEYYSPAIDRAKKVKTDDGKGIQTAAGQLILVDAAIQHGVGEDEDGLDALLKEAAKAAGPGPTEHEFLNAFLKVRVKHLSGAADAETREAWAESVPRVSALKQILDSGNSDLKGPLKFDVYKGDHYNEPAVA